ncbi:MAG: response regulator [Candidatus Binatia bacterium]
MLLVDDDPALLGALRRALRREPYEILVASNAPEALATLAARRIDVVVSDETMPGMTGTELLARVHASHPHTIRMMLTGRGSLPLAVRAINRGQVHRFFAKPCDPTDLASAIQQALQQRALLDGSRRLLDAVRGASSTIAAEEPAEPEALLREIEQQLAAMTNGVPAPPTTAPALPPILDALPVGVFVTDVNGRLTAVSARLLAMTGMQREALLGRAWDTLVHPDDRAAIGEPREHGDVVRLMTSDGSIRLVDARVAPLRGSANGTGGLIGSVAEVST